MQQVHRLMAACQHQQGRLAQQAALRIQRLPMFARSMDAGDMAVQLGLRLRRFKHGGGISRGRQRTAAWVEPGRMLQVEPAGLRGRCGVERLHIVARQALIGDQGLHLHQAELQLESQQTGLAPGQGRQRVEPRCCLQCRCAVETSMQSVVGVQRAVEQAARIARTGLRDARKRIDDLAGNALPGQRPGASGAGQTGADDQGLARMGRQGQSSRWLM